jgi:hypothetical protein
MCGCMMAKIRSLNKKKNIRKKSFDVVVIVDFSFLIIKSSNNSAKKE